jgi:hypothetical protein
MPLISLNPQGVIAQLGERYNGIVEVGGSIPPGSTSQIKNPMTQLILLRLECDHALRHTKPHWLLREEMSEHAF